MRWDGQALEWLAKRGSTVVAIGRDLPAAQQVIRYEGDDDPKVARHAEVLIPELLAATWWRLQPTVTARTHRPAASGSRTC